MLKDNGLKEETSLDAVFIAIRTRRSALHGVCRPNIVHRKVEHIGCFRGISFSCGLPGVAHLVLLKEKFTHLIIII